MKVLIRGGSGFIGSQVPEGLVDVRVPAAVEAPVAGGDAVCHRAAMVGLGDVADVTGHVSTNDLGTPVLLEALWRRSFTGRLVLASSMVVYGPGLARCPEHGVLRPGPRRPAQLEAGCFDPECPAPGCGATLGREPIDESCAPDLQNVNAATKVHQEHLCAVWGREAAAGVVALRYHNVYGPRMLREQLGYVAEVAFDDGWVEFAHAPMREDAAG